MILALTGLITLFGLVSINNGMLMGGWILFLTRLFGWGGYIFPVGLFIIGIWLILRDFEQLPQISVERGVGLIFLFILILTSMHFVLLPDGKEAALTLVKEGKGGGYIGAWLQYLLRAGLGLGGTIVALLAWFLISLAITLDRSVLALFNWISPLVLKI